MAFFNEVCPLEDRIAEDCMEFRGFYVVYICCWPIQSTDKQVIVSPISTIHYPSSLNSFSKRSILNNI